MLTNILQTYHLTQTHTQKMKPLKSSYRFSTSMKTLLFSALAFFFILAPSSSEAKNCKCAETGITVYPLKSQSVSRKTRIWVRLPANVSKALPFGTKEEFSDYPGLWAGSFTQKQLKIELLDGENVVRAYRNDLASGQWRMVVLRPTALLKRNHAYQVRIGVGSWSSIIRKFKTGTAVDATAPTEKALNKIKFISDRQKEGLCQSPSPYAKLYKNAKFDNNNAPLLGVWFPNQSGEMDFKKLPNLVIPFSKETLFLGRRHQCSEVNFLFPTGASNTSLGFRLGDFSGNWGPEQSLSFTYGSFSKPWTWSPNKRVLFWGILIFLIFVLATARVWMFQRASDEALDDFLVVQSEIKSDGAWMGLKKLVKMEKPFRRGNFLLFLLQVVLFVLGGYVFMQSAAHFSDAKTALSQLYMLVTPLVGFTALICGINLMYTLKIRSKRKQIVSLPVADHLRAPIKDLLSSWGKPSAPAK